MKKERHWVLPAIWAILLMLLLGGAVWLIYSLLSKIAVGWPGFLHIYFDLFSGAIQTYVFCMLTMVFTSQKMPQEN